MRPLEPLLIGLAMTGLAGMGTVLGAAITWRLVHRTEPPPPPLWVSVTGECSVLLLAVPLAVAGPWLTALVAAVGLSVMVVAQAFARIRATSRPSGR